MDAPMHFSEIYDPDTQEWAVFRVHPNGTTEPWVHIKPSTVAKGGMGAFAARPFKKGTTLGWYTGRVCTENDPMLEGEYAMGLSRDLVVDAAAGGSWTRFINDGRYRRRNDKTNAEAGPEMDIVTIHYVAKGKELFIDYGKEYWASRRS